MQSTGFGQISLFRLALIRPVDCFRLGLDRHPGLITTQLYQQPLAKKLAGPQIPVGKSEIASPILQTRSERALALTRGLF